MLEELISLVEKMLQKHEQMLALAGEKKEILIRGDMQALQALTGRELALIKEIEVLEKKRQEMGRELARHRGIPLEQLTARRVEQMAADADQAERMHKVTERLSSVLKKLQEANELNRQLLQQSLAFVQVTLDALTQTPPQTQYQEQGKTAPVSPQRRFFDAKI